MGNELLTNNMFFYVWIPIWFVGFVLSYMLLIRAMSESATEYYKAECRSKVAFLSLFSWGVLIITIIIAILLLIIMGIEKAFQFGIVPFLRLLEHKPKKPKEKE